ncbi:phosphotransferase family protein [Brachybacterium huguangmaarense]
MGSDRPSPRGDALLDRLDPRQRELLASWFSHIEPCADHSWGLVDTVVLEATVPSARGDARVIVKAGGPSDHHIGREIRAHRDWTGPWRGTGSAPELLRADDDARLLVTSYLPGRLVLDTPAAEDPDSYLQAGRLLAELHDQMSVSDPTFWARHRDRALRFLDSAHAIDDGIAASARDEVENWPTPPAVLVPTHGDFHPRNWLVDPGGTVRIIDLGRADLRPRIEDLTRMTTREFVGRPDLDAAFCEGYGSDPRTEDPAGWRRALLGEAIGTAVWAHQVGDAPFEAHSHRMLAELLG